MTTTPRGGDRDNVRPRIFWFVVASALWVALVLLWPRITRLSSGKVNPPAAVKAGGGSVVVGQLPIALRRFGSVSQRSPTQSAEEIVAGKVRQLGKSRRAIAERIARRSNQDLPPEIDAFFKAIDKGDWAEIDRLWNDFHSKRDRPDLGPYRALVLDAYGAAEQAHLWPAQKLLDYGNTIMDSMRPGMVYVGGTDDGRWVPELMNETSDDPHIMITQNALADGTYMDFLSELYGDQFHTLSKEDSARAFQDYYADAQRRWQHDLDFPDEPKQALPGENIQMVDGKVQVTGQVAVMAINERIMQMLVAQNPELSFALQESFPMRGFYADAVPLGPLMELNAPGEQGSFTADSAAQSVDYWRSAAQTLLADPEASGSSVTLVSYSHDMNATANLLAAHNFTSEAEEAYRLASQVWPANLAPVEGLAKVLAQSGHADQARTLLDTFASRYPDQRKAVEAAAALWRATGTP